MPVLEEKLLEEKLLEEKLLEEKKTVPTDRGSSATRASVPDLGLGQCFLKLPVPVVLLTVWLVGVALMGLSALTLYHLFLMLVEALAGL
jgi:hypothetical protein